MMINGGPVDEDEPNQALRDAAARRDEVLDDPSSLWLDPSEPFEAVLIDMVKVNRKKRADYAHDGDPWSNFRFTAGVLGIEPQDAAIHNVAQKLARLTALRSNGRDPQNEAVLDTYLDLAVYGVIALAIVTHPSGAVVKEAW